MNVLLFALVDFVRYLSCAAFVIFFRGVSRTIWSQTRIRMYVAGM